MDTQPARLNRELADLGVTSGDLLKHLREPGVTGQMRLHAQLEDLKQTLTHLQAQAGKMSISERTAARGALSRCDAQLRRVDHVLLFIGEMLDRHTATNMGSDDYSTAGHSLRVRGPQLPRRHGSLEVEG